MLRAVGAVVGLLKSDELLFESVQLDVLIVERAAELVDENGAGPEPSKQLAVEP